MAKEIAKRITGRALQKLRARHLRSSPICVMCQRRVATEVDHKIALISGGADIEQNRQSLCHSCHATKTALDLGKRPQRMIDVLTGLPLPENT